MVPWTAVVVAYLTFIRQLNLLSIAHSLWGGPHTMRRGHFHQVPASVHIAISSLKTIRPAAQAVSPSFLALPFSSLHGACASPFRHPNFPVSLGGSSSPTLSAPTHPLWKLLSSGGSRVLFVKFSGFSFCASSQHINRLIYLFIFYVWFSPFWSSTDHKFEKITLLEFVMISWATNLLFE